MCGDRGWLRNITGRGASGPLGMIERRIGDPWSRRLRALWRAWRMCGGS